PSAHDVSVGDFEGARISRAPGRGVHLLPGARRTEGRLRREAHGLTRGGDCLPGRGGRAGALRRGEPGIGIVYTRTGRRFFSDPALERGLLDRLARALTGSGLWEEFKTDWMCIDAELLPWSAKALALVKRQYATVGAAAGAGLHEAVTALTAAAGIEGAAT